LGIYAILFFWLYPQQGSGVAALVTVPVVVIAWFWGAQLGLVTGLLAFPFNTLLLNLAGESGWDVVIRDGGGLGMIAVLFAGGLLGRMSDLSKFARRQLAERRQAEEQLRKSEESFVKAFNSSPAALMITRLADGKYIAVNEAYANIVGFDSSELLDHLTTDFNIYIYPDQRGEILDQLFASGSLYNYETVIRNKAGEIRTVLASLEQIQFNGEDCLLATLVDITERKRVERELNESQTRLEGIIETAMDGIITTDENQNIVLFNDAAEKMFGISASEAIGQSIDRFIPSQFRDVHREHIRKFGETGTTSRIMHQDVLTALHANGEEFPIEASISQVDIKGQKFYTVVHRDVTERMLAEQKIRDTTQFLESIVDSSPVAIISYDVDGHVLTWNSAAERVFGWKSEEVIGQIAPHIGHEHLHEFHALRQRVIQGEALNHVELIRQKKDGTPIVINLNTAPRFNALGELTGYTAIIADITERKQAEEKMQRQNQRLKALRDIDTAILAADSVESIVDAALSHIRELVGCKRAAMALIDWNTNEVVVFDVKTTDETSITRGVRIPLALYQDMFETFSKKQPVIMHDLSQVSELPPLFQTIKGEGLLSICMLPLFSQEKQIGAFNMSSEIPGFFDKEKINLGREVANQVAIAITQSRLVDELEEHLRERETLITDLTAKNAELESFTYTVSHDLKSPLVTIKGFLGYLEQDAIDGNVERFKDDEKRISNAVEKMQELLNDLLELSRIGRFVSPSEKFSFEDLARTTIELVRGHLNEHNVTVRIQPDLPVIYGDWQRLIEVLQNLLDNAAKYMGGQKEPIIEIGQSGEENGMPVLFVKDNGMGIESEHHERIFGLFNKLDAMSDGTGVGLALVKRIIEFHGGRIWVESEAGVGTTFYFTLPTSPAI